MSVQRLADLEKINQRFAKLDLGLAELEAKIESDLPGLGIEVSPMGNKRKTIAVGAKHSFDTINSFDTKNIVDPQNVVDPPNVVDPLSAEQAILGSDRLVEENLPGFRSVRVPNQAANKKTVAKAKGRKPKPR